MSVDSRLLYMALVAVVAVQRLAELALSRRHEHGLRRQGAYEVGAGHYPWMVAVHTAFLASCGLEVWFLKPPFRPALAVAMLGVLTLATALRYWAVSTLGRRWTTRVLILPGAPRIRRGPYRFFAHPNYLAVVLEIAALPLVHGAWRTAVVFTLLDAAVLGVRIRAEEKGLRGPHPAGG